MDSYTYVNWQKPKPVVLAIPDRPACQVCDGLWQQRTDAETGEPYLAVLHQAACTQWERR